MARTKRGLTLQYTERAELELFDIWEWTAGKFGFKQADRYRRFLLNQTESIAREFPKSVRKLPGTYSFASLKYSEKRAAAGHIVVFEKRRDTLVVVHYFHTSQDWESKLGGD